MPDSTGPQPNEPVDAEIVPTPGPAPAPPAADYDEHGVPSLDYVRDKIEGRYATSLGAAELAEDAAGRAAGQSVEEQEAERAEKAKAKLEEIRKSLG
jgi:phage shock protein A